MDFVWFDFVGCFAGLVCICSIVSWLLIIVGCTDWFRIVCAILLVILLNFFGRHFCCLVIWFAVSGYWIDLLVWYFLDCVTCCYVAICLMLCVILFTLFGYLFSGLFVLVCFGDFDLCLIVCFGDFWVCCFVWFTVVIYLVNCLIAYFDCFVF